MPRFMYTIIFLSCVLWLVTGVWVFMVTPDSITKIFVLLFIIFCAISLSLSVPIFFAEIKRAHHHGLEKPTYRRSLRLSMFIGLFITGTLGLKAFNLVNVINVILFLILCGTIFPFVIKKH
jgi:hypothetical protein